MPYVLNAGTADGSIEICDASIPHPNGIGEPIARADSPDRALQITAALNDRQPHYPEGKLDPTDEGELTLAVDAHEGLVRLSFGKPVAWLGMPPDQAAGLARMIMEKARLAAVMVRSAVTGRPGDLH